nr:DUF5689 domain-containing protein [Bacteroidales bacterium]
MKIKSIITLVAVAALALLNGCKKTEELGPAEITIKSEATVNFDSSESSQTVNFVATRDWVANVAENAQNWLSVTPASGSASNGEQSLKIEVLANPEKDRTGNVTISILSNGKALGSKTVTVNQKGEKGSSFITIAALRALAPTGDATVAVDEGVMIKGSVLSNVELNNLSSKKIVYIQDETAGVQLFLGANSTF